MAWTAKITGDMTLSVVDEAGLPVLGVEMVRMNTMRSGDGGELLVRTWNDLHLLAMAASPPNHESLKPEGPSEGYSPMPWKIEFHPAARRLRVRDAQGDGYSRPSVPPPGLVPGDAGLTTTHIQGR